MAGSERPPSEGPRGDASGDPDHLLVPLSDDEVQELIGSGHPSKGNGHRQDPQEPRARLLVLSRDDEELRMLRGVLGGLSFEVIAVRNPFTALDQLRLRRFSGIISDFEIWADRGSLLFDRIAEGVNQPPVVFICSGPRAAASARATGAAGVLRHPLDPRDLERIAGTFRTRIREASGPLAGPVTPPPPPAPPPRPERVTVTGGDRRSPAEAADPVPDTPEIRWLRFFFHARADLRAAPAGVGRIAAVLSAWERHLGAACGVGYALDDGWWITVRPGAARLAAGIAVVLESRSAPAAGDAPAADRPVIPEGMVLVPLDAGGRRGVFAALPGPVISSAPVPETYAGELRALIDEAGSP